MGDYTDQEQKHFKLGMQQYNQTVYRQAVSKQHIYSVQQYSTQ